MTYDGRIIDSDVHNAWKSERELIPYLSEDWRDFVLRQPYPTPLALNGPRVTFPHPRGGVNSRLETFPADGAPPGSDYELLRKQLLDHDGVTCAILAVAVASSNAGVPNPWLSDEIVRAINTWTLEQWLSIPDDRLYSVVFVPTQNPAAGADEIRRVARHPRIVEARIVSNGLGRPLGHPGYDPVYRAASDAGLPVSIHIHAGESQLGAVALNAAGNASSYLEFHSLLMQPAMHHVSSMLVNGVFERFPDLHFVMVETGTQWIPWLLWQLDGRYAELKRESPWLKRRPSEYFHDHVRVTTQPLEVGRTPRHTLEYLSLADGIEDVLCYSSDYPHWDADTVEFAQKLFPKSWLPKVFSENAMAAYPRLR